MKKILSLITVLLLTIAAAPAEAFAEPSLVEQGQACLEEVPPKYEEAAQFFRRAGLLGDGEGYYRLARMYEDGLLTVGNPCTDDLEALGKQKAGEYYLLAAKSGYTDGQDLSGSSVPQESANAMTEPEGLMLELLGMQFESRGGDLLVTPKVRILNETGEDIMKVRYGLTFYDEEGTEIGSDRMFYATDDPLLSGCEAIQDDCRFVLKFSKVPDHAEIHALEYITTEEIPPIHVPKEGEYLYEALDCENLNALPDLLPERITVNVDQMGYERRAVFETGTGLEEAVEAFMKIRVGADDAPSVTDNYNWFQFDWEDGTSYMIRLSLYSLEYETNAGFHVFYLLDSDAFWDLVYGKLE